MKEIAAKYNPKEFEEVLYSKWEKEGLFHAVPDSTKKPFTILIPPPNVTGILHMGHALNNTLQDILIRRKKMQGWNSMWMPGTDHAGIATQNVVEKKIGGEGKKRDDLGREMFLKEVWKWQEEYGSTIITQLKRLGASCDWDRMRFTMDDEYSNAVKEVFIRLLEKGLIYQGDYIINWCPRCHTALSDEEAPHQDRKGFLYYIKYPLSSGTKSKEVIVATTRPETMLGDTAVAVNPKDKRYKNIIGGTVTVPLLNKKIPVIADDFVDPEFGTGAVKVTPAHDPNDFEMGNRHGLERVLVMNPDGTMNHNAGDFEGADRFEARERIVEVLKQQGLLLKIEEHSHAVGHCYRCNTMIEPYLSRQWFVNMKPLAMPAIDAVKKGKIKFYPKRWTKVYLNWMENIRDWCISRQIWWGHRLPVYYCKNCVKQAVDAEGHGFKERAGIIVSRVKPEKCPDCGGTDFRQDEDVLDTWFSSWLWPFVTLGWPEERWARDEGRETNSSMVLCPSPIVRISDLNYFYPTSVLVTAPEILFFWVARMIMAGIEFMGDIPFKHVYIHGTVRDVTGRKMSKSLGNVIDPIEIINEFGTDALRYSIIAITAAGQDVYLSKEKFHLGRNFANKIWNASRFVLMNIDPAVKPAMGHNSGPWNNIGFADKWILSRLNSIIAVMNKALDNYRFNEAAMAIYDFFWHDFCDWYVEIVKPEISEHRAVLLHVLESSLKLLHPFMPFVTEAVWQNIKERDSLTEQAWPKDDKKLIDKTIELDMAITQDIIVNIRNIRADMNISHSAKVKVILSPLKKGIETKIKLGFDYIKNLAKIDELTIDTSGKKHRHAASAILEGINVFIPLEALIDLDAEKARLTKKKDDLDKQLKGIEKRLNDKNFVTKAPEKIVNQEKEKKEILKSQVKRIDKTLNDL